MEKKLEFIRLWQSGQYSISELSRSFEISRPTAYHTIRKYKKYGKSGLLDQSRAPLSHPNRTSLEVERRIVKLRKHYSRWGAEKIWKLLHREFSSSEIPSIVTVNNIMKRHGLILPRKRIRRVKPLNPIFAPPRVQRNMEYRL